MPICIECRYPVKTLYTEYSKADDRSLGKGVRLTQCPRCKRFADKYVEHDFVVLFIDLVLIKPQLYRHLLFNRLGRDDHKFDRSILRFGILLVLFDVYLTWTRIEKLPHPPGSLPDSESQASYARMQARPLIVQYLFFLLLVCASTAAFHAPIRLLCGVKPERITKGVWTAMWKKLVPYYPHPTPLSTALLVSSCTKLFPLLLVIWDYDLPISAAAVSWAVIVNNIAAVEILLDCGYLRAIVLVGIGAALRWAVATLLLSAAGLQTGWGPGDVELLWRGFKVLFMGFMHNEKKSNE